MRRLFSARRRARPDLGVPILLLSFNRLHYLRQVLEAIAPQLGLEPERVHLFQDGAVNAYSGRVAARQSDVDACVALFRQHFPRGGVHAAPANIGIAESFFRAERFAFEESGAECAYFFEDDLVPGPAYLRSWTVSIGPCGTRTGSPTSPPTATTTRASRASARRRGR